MQDFVHQQYEALKPEECKEQEEEVVGLLLSRFVDAAEGVNGVWVCRNVN